MQSITKIENIDKLDIVNVYVTESGLHDMLTFEFSNGKKLCIVYDWIYEIYIKENENDTH